MTTENEKISIPEIKRVIRNRLPKSTFEKNPLRMLLAPFWILVACVAGYVILMTPAHWSLKILMGLVIGNSWSILNMMGHELLHGGMGGSKRLQRFVAGVCGMPMVVAPSAWEFNHMRRHHPYTNHEFRDTDTIGLMKRYVNRPSAQKLIDRFPGSGRWSSLLFYAYAFTYQQVSSGLKMTGATGRAVKTQIALMVAFWLSIAILSGADFIYTVIIPFVVGNAISLSYITTQHWLRPLSNDNNAVEATLNLSQPKWLASMHLCNAYHLEHHLFPAIPFNKLPAVRQILMDEFPDAMLIMPHWQALKWVFKTPRVYADKNHLVDLRDPSRWFDLKAFERAIRDPEIDLSKCTASRFFVTQG